MLETKYYRDMNHNYLIIKESDKSPFNPYQFKMITGNNIPGLLNVSQRYIDGEIFFYYEISSLQTLKTMFEHRKMDKTMAVRLLTGLAGIFKEVKRYLLNDDGLLLSPDYIYLNWEKEEVYFVFFPYKYESVANQVQQLFEYLVRIVDHSDEKLVDMIYDLFKLAERNILVVEDIESQLVKLSQTQVEEWELPRVDEVVDEALPTYALPYETKPKQDEGQKQKFLILTLISAAGFIFTLIYQQFFILTARQLLLSWVMLVVFVIFFLMTGAIYGLLIYRSRSGECNEKVMDFDEQVKPAQASQTSEYYGDTIFLTEDTKEYKLYGFGRGNKHIIDMDSFPFTIGKLVENTDFCLKESSISRVHVKFTRYEETVFMTDLNSTNGTHKNGLRLDPNETVPIEAGDEIRLGKLNFYFR